MSHDLPVLGEIQQLANRWRTDARDLKRYSPSSEVASTLEAVAAEIDRLVLHLESSTKYLTVRGYAEMHGVTPQTVRNWIRTGQLTTVNGTQGRKRLIRMDTRRDKSHWGRRDRV